MPEFQGPEIGPSPEDIEMFNNEGELPMPTDEGPGQMGNAFDQNMVETLPERDVHILASDLVEHIKNDRDARKRRDKQYEEGLRRTGLSGEAPAGADFEGASKVVHPVLAEACVDYSSAAIKVLLPAEGPVKMHQLDRGKPADFDRAERKRDFMNWQLTEEMPEYRSELEILLTQQPLGGAQYMKFWFDETRGRNVSEFVPIDDVYLPFGASSFDSASRKTLIVRLDRIEFTRRIQAGIYVDIQLPDPPAGQFEESSANVISQRIEGREDAGFNEDGLRVLFETYVWLDLEGFLAPYIVIIDEYYEKVIAIYRNWDEEDQLRDELQWVVEFPFIPWRGAQGVGLAHLIGGLSAAATGALRALLDSAHLATLPGGVKLKGARSTGQNLSVSATEIAEIDAPSTVDDIRKVFMPWPFPQPSPTLFQLLGFLVEAAKGVVSTAEEKIADASNTMPVGTALALIEQGSKAFSAIHLRLHTAQAKSLRIIQRLNAKFLVEDRQIKKFGRVIATRQDFQIADDVIPISDPNIFSETQRYAQMQALQQMAADQSVQWNRLMIYRRMMAIMRVENPDEILPMPPEPFTNQMAFLEALPAMSGTQLKADLEQDHVSHITEHLHFLLDPIFGAANQAIVNPGFGVMMNHVLQHLNMLYQVMKQQAIQGAAQELQTAIVQRAQSVGAPIETIQMMVNTQMQAALPMIVERANMVFETQMKPSIAGLVPLMQQASELVRQRMPPPPPIPEVQIAQMEIERKKNYDQAMIQLKTQEQTTTLQMKDEAQKFDQQMQQLNAQMAKVSEMLDRQAQIQNNEEDNRQHQFTEILKNRDDNQTQTMIEEMRQHGLSIRESLGQEYENYRKQMDGAVQMILEEIRGKNAAKETGNGAVKD